MRVQNNKQEPQTEEVRVIQMGTREGNSGL